MDRWDSFSRPPLLVSAAFLALSIGRPSGLEAQGTASQLPDSAIVVEGIVVTGTPVPVSEKTLGNHISIVKGEDLRAQGVTQVVDALRAVSGVTIVQSGSFGAHSSVFLRGGESDYVLVLLDGVPLNQPGGSIDLAGLTTGDIERIEILRGPASGLYGSDAVAGVIQIITRSGDSGLAGSGTLRGGSFGSIDGLLELRGGNDLGSFGASLASYDTDGILDFNNGHRKTVLSGRAELRIDDASTARVTARLLDRVYRFPTDDTGALVDINQSSFSEEATLGIEVGRRLGGSFDLRTLVTLHDVDSGTDDAPDGPDDNVGFYGFQSLDAMRRVTGDLRANWRLSEVTILTTGAELEQQRVRSFSEILSEFGSRTGRSDNSRSNVAGYGHALTSVGRVALNGGVRVEDNQQFGKFVSFQTGSVVTISPDTQIRFAAGRGIKEPTFAETFATGFALGNPDLEPEQSTSWEVGVQQELLDRVRIGATWFNQSFEDLIQFTFSPPKPTDPNYFNVAAANSRGMELELDATLGAAEITVGWTWLDTEVVDSGFDQGPSAMFVQGEPLIRRPRNQATLGTRGVIGGRVRWSADLGWVGKRSDRNFSVFPADRVTMESYILVNLGLDATIFEVGDGGPGMDLLLRGENLGNIQYQEVFGFAAPGRGIYVGGRIRWEDRSKRIRDAH